MKYKIQTTTQFERSVSRLSIGDKNEVYKVINTIATGIPLTAKYKDHPLKGNKKGIRDCHVKYDLVLLYKLERDICILTAVDVGSHSSVFRI